MTKEQTLNAFWSGFDLLAIDENFVPADEADKPDFPYITYQTATDSFGQEVALAGSLWYRSESWAAANVKAEEIGSYIGRGGIILRCDGGAMWIKRGTPFAQNMGDDSDDQIKRKYLNITVEYLTEN